MHIYFKRYVKKVQYEHVWNKTQTLTRSNILIRRIDASVYSCADLYKVRYSNFISVLQFFSLLSLPKKVHYEIVYYEIARRRKQKKINPLTRTLDAVLLSNS